MTIIPNVTLLQDGWNIRFTAIRSFMHKVHTTGNRPNESVISFRQRLPPRWITGCYPLPGRYNCPCYVDRFLGTRRAYVDFPVLEYPFALPRLRIKLLDEQLSSSVTICTALCTAIDHFVALRWGRPFALGC